MLKAFLRGKYPADQDGKKSHGMEAKTSLQQYKASLSLFGAIVATKCKESDLGFYP